MLNAHALPLLITPLLAQIAPAAPPRVLATRVSVGPSLDGVLDDEAWKSAPAITAFTQKFPNEGAAPTERTTMRIIYDDESIYVAFECEQLTAPVVERLTRRGRLVEADWVSVAFGTRGDGKSAFEFLVNASGVLVDSLLFNDTETAENWDENWEARTRVTKRGWSAEIKVPLHILRFATAAVQTWDLQARRNISARQETDEWSYIPRSAGGEVSHYGKLEGLRGLTAKSPLEIRPFVVGRVQRRDPATTQLASGTDISGSAGLDLKWHPTYDLTLDAAFNPDFAQVEADQLVLNLSTYETYYPEKRPFFLEGIDMFSTPIQLVYTRRIGRAPPSPVLRTDLGERLVDVPAASTIYGASKLTGRVSEHWSIGTLQAVTARSDVQVQLADGSRLRRLADPLTSFNVLRAKRDLGANGHIGVMTTAVSHAEPSSSYPQTGGQQLCASGTLTSPLARCFNDAYVGSVDWRWRSPSGDFVTGGQAAISTLHNGPPRVVRDGTVLRPGDAGAGIVGYVNKEGGKHWVGDINGEYNDRKLEVNDMGFDRRANNYRWRFDLEYRELEKWWSLLEAHAKLEYFGRYNIDGLDIGSGYQLNVSGKLTNFWTFFTELHYRPRWFDDREVGDGTALQRAGLIGYEAEVSTDPTKPVSFTMETQSQALSDGLTFNGQFGVLWRVVPQFDLEVLPTVVYTRGEPRYVGAGTAPSQYLFGKLEAKSIGAVVRATYTFAPRLTLQTYGQVFLSSGHYTEFSSFQARAPGAVVHRGELQPYTLPLSTNPDFEQGVLNVNVVLRWEYRLGSIAYLVYTRAQTPATMLLSGEAASLNLGAVRRAPAADVVLVKLSYWWG